MLCTQLGMASAEQVMAAAAAWMADRSLPLSERLLESGVIEQHQHDLLQSLVQEAVRSSGGDAARALESLGGRQVVEQTFAGSIVLDSGAAPEATAHPAEAAAAAADEQVTEPGHGPRYQVGEEIGHGGQARVRLAYDSLLGREVAWKELRGDAAKGTVLSGAGSRRNAQEMRFLREARITGRLEHPNIVPVYDLGQAADGRPYYTMRLVKGETLAARLAACHNLSQRLRLLGSVWDLANAIAFAHENGVIHRDIKPDNVVVGPLGETVVLDWGLAKARDGDDIKGARLRAQAEAWREGSTASTVEGSALGTPAYMSPEQAEGAIDQIDERSDVWGLGAVLYQVLTGRPPHQGETPYEIVGRAMSQEVVPAGQVCPEVPGELAAIAARALNRDKSRRYANAREMAEDISAFMTGQRVRAYDYGLWELLGRFARRHRAALAATGLVLLTIIVALVLLAVAYRNESRARHSERQARLEAQLNLSQAFASRAEELFRRQQLLSARVLAAASLLENPAHPQGRLPAADFAKTHPRAGEILVQARSLLDQSEQRPVLELERVLELGGQVASLEQSPDGRRLAAVGFQKGIFVFATGDWQRQWHHPGHQFATYAVTFLPDGEHLVSTGYQPSVALWKIGSSEPLWQRRLPPPSVKLAVVSPDGALLAFPHQGRIHLWEPLTGRARGDFAAHEDRIWGLAFAGENRLATASADRTLALWQLPAGKLLWRSRGHSGRIYAMARSHDGRRLVTASTDRTLHFWNLADGSEQRVIRDPEDGFYAAAWSRDDTLVAAGGTRRRVSVWDVRSGVKRIALVGHGDAIEKLVFSSDGRRLLSSSDDGSIRVWKLQPGEPGRFLVHETTVYDMVVSTHGNHLFTATASGDVWKWSELEERTVRRSLVVKFAGSATCLAESAPARSLAIGGRSKELWVLPLDGAGGRQELHGLRGPVRALAFSPDGRLLAAGTSAKEIHLWELAGGKLLYTRGDFGTYLTEVVFSADGRTLYTAGGRPEILAWDAAGGRVTGKLTGHEGIVTDLALVPGAGPLVSGSKDGTIIAWDMTNGRSAWRLDAGAPVEWLAVAADGRWLAAATDANLLKAWSLPARRLVAVLPLPSGPGPLAFLPGRLRLAITSGSEVQLVDFDTSGAAEPARRLLDRAQRQAGLVLEGFDLVYRQPSTGGK